MAMSKRNVNPRKLAKTIRIQPGASSLVPSVESERQIEQATDNGEQHKHTPRFRQMRELKLHVRVIGHAFGVEPEPAEDGSIGKHVRKSEAISGQRSAAGHSAFAG